jgi:hypothetical protein
MKIEEIAKRLVDYCRKAEWEGAHKELYASNAISIEPYATPEFEKEIRGMEAIGIKAKKFNEMVEKIHRIEVSDPLVAKNTIAFKLTMDLTMKGMGRVSSPELCLYQVQDGKIISEEFFL